jgi:hypothetical protein
VVNTKAELEHLNQVKTQTIAIYNAITQVEQQIINANGKHSRQAQLRALDDIAGGWLVMGTTPEHLERPVLSFAEHLEKTYSPDNAVDVVPAATGSTADTALTVEYLDRGKVRGVTIELSDGLTSILARWVELSVVEGPSLEADPTSTLHVIRGEGRAEMGLHSVPSLHIHTPTYSPECLS